MFNYPNVPTPTVQREIDQFMEDLKADGFDFTDVQRSGEKAVPGESGGTASEGKRARTPGADIG